MLRNFVFFIFYIGCKLLLLIAFPFSHLHSRNRNEPVSGTSKAVCKPHNHPFPYTSLLQPLKCRHTPAPLSVWFCWNCEFVKATVFCILVMMSSLWKCTFPLGAVFHIECKMISCYTGPCYRLYERSLVWTCCHVLLCFDFKICLYRSFVLFLYNKILHVSVFIKLLMKLGHLHFTCVLFKSLWTAPFSAWNNFLQHVM